MGVTSSQLPQLQHETKSVMGRPCKFCEDKEKIMKTVKAYISDAIDKKQGIIPYVEELAILLDVDEDTISNWANKKKDEELEHPEFFGAYKKIKTIQKLKLLKRTNGRYQPTGAIFQLKVNHGLIEAEKKILTGDSKQPLEIIITEAKNSNDE